jgi:tRNA 5-methylaminomethyl-2-thiouridine biosynthesis bifunctional protein
VVVANAGDALRLLGHPNWPVRQLRGQLSHLPAACLTHVPTLPVAGAGYVLPECNGRVTFGATSQENDDDPQVRDSDHAHNLAQLAQLMGKPPTALGLAGRTAWRWTALDRLPLIGPVPIVQEPQNAQDAGGWHQPQHVPRQPGLFVFAALGSRGITWAALGGQVLAAQIAGAPVPLENSLIDAIDPARFRVRALRRGAP